jgi:hypothetical protein
LRLGLPLLFLAIGLVNLGWLVWVLVKEEGLP